VTTLAGRLARLQRDFSAASYFPAHKSSSENLSAAIASSLRVVAVRREQRKNAASRRLAAEFHEVTPYLTGWNPLRFDLNQRV
jgi:hypothetical protein